MPSQHAQNGRRVVLLSQWFPPEHAPIGYMLKELAQHLKQNGFAVEVVTGFPNHPTGRVFAPYRSRWLARDTIDGVPVTRLWSYISEKRSLLTRAVNFFSFVTRAFLYLLTCPKPAVIFAVLQPQPIGLVVLLLAKLRGFKVIFNIQDLHTDVLIDLGVARGRWMTGLLRFIERSVYRHADAIAVICDGFKSHVRAHGGACAVSVIPNWIDIDEIRPDGAAGLSFLQKHGLDPSLPVALYAGTIGHVSGAQVVIDAARLQPGIQWLFVGEGPLLPELRVRAQGLPTVHFLPFQPREALGGVQNCATVSLVSLSPGKGIFSVPSKVLGYMAAGKPVVASVDPSSETARLVHDAACGYVVTAGDPAALAAGVQRLVDNAGSRDLAGLRGRQYLEGRYTRQAVCAQYQSLIEQTISS